MWSDNETATDCLGFRHLTTAITSIVRDENLLPTTIGVFGDWSSGKKNPAKPRPAVGGNGPPAVFSPPSSRRYDDWLKCQQRVLQCQLDLYVTARGTNPCDAAVGVTAAG